MRRFGGAALSPRKAAFSGFKSRFNIYGSLTTLYDTMRVKKGDENREWVCLRLRARQHAAPGAKPAAGLAGATKMQRNLDGKDDGDEERPSGVEPAEG